MGFVEIILKLLILDTFNENIGNIKKSTIIKKRRRRVIFVQDNSYKGRLRKIIL